MSQTFGDGITQTNCTASVATKQCDSFPAMKIVIACRERTVDLLELHRSPSADDEDFVLQVDGATSSYRFTRMAELSVPAA
jgi:hypothetical protein